MSVNSTRLLVQDGLIGLIFFAILYLPLSRLDYQVNNSQPNKVYREFGGTNISLSRGEKVDFIPSQPNYIKTNQHAESIYSQPAYNPTNEPPNFFDLFESPGISSLPGTMKSIDEFKLRRKH